MTWVRYDDHAALHPKVAPLDDATYRLWREAIEWCSRNLTDGRIAAELLEFTSRRATRARAAVLVTRKLWHQAGYACPSEKCPPSGVDGWVIHDYWYHQPTAEKVLAERAAKAERQRAYVARMSAKRMALKSGADASRDASTDASHGPPLEGLVDPLLALSPVPVPVPVPEGRRETRDGAAARLAGLGGRSEDQRPPPPSPNGRHDSRPCRTCGNALTSAYHRNVCSREVA